MSQTNVTEAEIATMLETGRKPDTAGQRTWPNWKVAVALATTTAETERLRAEAYERAALIADTVASNNYSMHNPRGQQAAEQIAAAIRKLAQKGGDA